MTQGETRQLTRVEDKIDAISNRIEFLAVENQARKGENTAMESKISDLIAERKSIRAGLWAICLLILSQGLSWLRAYLPVFYAVSHSR